MRETEPSIVEEAPGVVLGVIVVAGTSLLHLKQFSGQSFPPTWILTFHTVILNNLLHCCSMLLS